MQMHSKVSPNNLWFNWYVYHVVAFDHLVWTKNKYKYNIIQTVSMVWQSSQLSWLHYHRFNIRQEKITEIICWSSQTCLQLSRNSWLCHNKKHGWWEQIWFFWIWKLGVYTRQCQGLFSGINHWVKNYPDYSINVIRWIKLIYLLFNYWNHLSPVKKKMTASLI